MLCYSFNCMSSKIASCNYGNVKQDSDASY